MAHKDSFTGCMVADILEVFKPEELEEIWKNMSEDDRRQEEEFKNDLSVPYSFLLNYHKYYDDEFYPLNVHKVLEINVSSSARGYRMRGRMEVSVFHECAFKRGVVAFTFVHYSSTMSDPEDENVEVWFLGCGKDECRNEGEALYKCGECKIKLDNGN